LLELRHIVPYIMPQLVDFMLKMLQTALDLVPLNSVHRASS